MFIESINEPGNALFIYGGACIALFFTGIWWYRRQDGVFGLFAITLALWTLANATRLYQDMPGWVFSAVLACWALANSLLCFGLLERKPEGFRRILLFAAATLILFDSLSGLPFAVGILPVLGLVVLVLLIKHIRFAGLHSGGKGALIILLVGALMFAFPLSSSPLYWQSGSVLYVAVALILTHRFAMALSEWEKLNRILQQRVDLEREKIDRQYRKLIDVESNNAAMKERQRIFQDVHDDIGARLLTIVHLSRAGRDQALARKALQELRDIVSIKNRADLSLADAIADICTQTLHALENAERNLNWVQTADIPDVPLSEGFFIQLKRAVREAVSLWLASAGKDDLTVHIVLQREQLQIRIEDPGASCIDTILESFRQPLARFNGNILLDRDLIFTVPL